jgi:hypothetical protein
MPLYCFFAILIKDRKEISFLDTETSLFNQYVSAQIRGQQLSESENCP